MTLIVELLTINVTQRTSQKRRIIYACGINYTKNIAVLPTCKLSWELVWAARIPLCRLALGRIHACDQVPPWILWHKNSVLENGRSITSSYGVCVRSGPVIARFLAGKTWLCSWYLCMVVEYICIMIKCPVEFWFAVIPNNLVLVTIYSLEYAWDQVFCRHTESTCRKK